MSLLLMLLAPGTPASTFPPAPTINSVTAQQGGVGQCSQGRLVADASVLVGWSLTVPGGTTGYSLRVNRSGTISGTPVGPTTIWSGPLSTSLISDAIPYKQSILEYLISYTYTLQVVRADGVVTSSMASNGWSAYYGNCG